MCQILCTNNQLSYHINEYYTKPNDWFSCDELLKLKKKKKKSLWLVIVEKIFLRITSILICINC